MCKHAHNDFPVTTIHAQCDKDFLKCIYLTDICIDDMHTAVEWAFGKSACTDDVHLPGKQKPCCMYCTAHRGQVMSSADVALHAGLLVA